MRAPAPAARHRPLLRPRADAAAIASLASAGAGGAAAARTTCFTDDLRSAPPARRCSGSAVARSVKALPLPALPPGSFARSKQAPVVRDGKDRAPEAPRVPMAGAHELARAMSPSEAH